MIERALVYIHTVPPARRFVGCGVLVEGGLVATCRHVWRMATEGRAAEVELSYPFSRVETHADLLTAILRSPCDQLPGRPPDLVLLQPRSVPDDVPALSPALDDRFQSGGGRVHAGRLSDSGEIEDFDIPCDIMEHDNAHGRRQFTGTRSEGYWVTHGSSGSPIFLDGGMQLAGILTLAELPGKKELRPLREAFMVPGTTIRNHLLRLKAEAESERRGLDVDRMQPILDRLTEQGVPLDQVPAKLREAVEALLARGAAPLPPSNTDADIEATRAASRTRLRALDTSGARELLQAKIEEEAELRARRLLPLLKERAAIERLAYDHKAAKGTFAEITALDPDDVWSWIALGDLWLTTGPLERAAAAFRGAAAAARRRGDEGDEVAARNRLGDVLMAHGDREGALISFRTNLRIRETLARRDPANAKCQRDLLVSHMKLGEAHMAHGDDASALTAFRASLDIAETLAQRAPPNAQRQRDLAVSYSKIGDVLMAQRNFVGALRAYRADLDVTGTLSQRDPSNASWQRDLSVSHDKIGDVLMAEGVCKEALAAFRASLAIRKTLAERDPDNAQWQRDLSISYSKIGGALITQGNGNEGLAAYYCDLAIAATLARRDPTNAEWQRDLMVSYTRIAEVSPEDARSFLMQALAIVRELQATGRLAPVDAWIPNELGRRLSALPGA